MEILIIIVLLGLIPATIASKKGKSFWIWWFFGMALFIVALPMALIMKSDQEKEALNKRNQTLTVPPGPVEGFVRGFQSGISSSLRKCPKCAELIQPEATVCKHCRSEIVPLTNNEVKISGKKIEESNQVPEWLKQVTQVGIVGFITVVLVSYFGGGDSSNTQKEAALLVVTASDIATAYDENTVAADQRFNGKKFEVTGIVNSISTDLMGDPYITLEGGVNKYMEPHFGFEKSEAPDLAKLYKGQKVTLTCIGKGDIVKTPMSDSCTLDIYW